MAADSPLALNGPVSPNHGVRFAAVHSIILHYTGMETAAGALAWLCNPASEVSSHYFIEEDGTIRQLVPESRRAWHAGNSFWAGETDLNSRSIGIEIVNPGHLTDCPPFAPAQIASVIALCRDIGTRHSIAPQNILAHSDIAPARKRDPGEAFPWGQLHAAGIGHYVPPAPLQGGGFLQIGDSGEAVEALQKMLALYGYGIIAHGQYDAETEAVVRAFQRHFRPARVDGIADASTLATLHQLLRSLPKLRA
ncbi:MAG: N-acetylmuramoyl-L-alanine amidase [Hyphomicrobiales bacterium]|nr:N-acetylmuramoyl-L-alanine amidase [Hyphomicrobiales bacterium]MDE2115566.1 N-acetylmuramoyl-L-alanine amidase [Hyphomicrobiales bacterium]